MSDVIGTGEWHLRWNREQRIHGKESGTSHVLYGNA